MAREHLKQIVITLLCPNSYWKTFEKILAEKIVAPKINLTETKNVSRTKFHQNLLWISGNYFLVKDFFIANSLFAGPSSDFGPCQKTKSDLFGPTWKIWKEKQDYSNRIK